MIVECVERELDPLNTNLVVADSTKTEKTICLAVSSSLKQYGIGGRARIFEVVQMVKPSRWQLAKYDSVDGKYLYNQSHLIGFQLAGENANEKNLIMGTRYFNVDGMLPFENEVAEYVKETNNHVLYRVTPVFKDTELVVRV